MTNTLVLGLIRRAHVRNAVLVDGNSGADTANTNANVSHDNEAQTRPLIVDPAKLRPVSRLGGATFARVTEGFDIPRPSWRDLQGRVREMMEKANGGRV